jgi:acyl-coenzyme A thioesterase PaaI-like protein
MYQALGGRRFLPTISLQIDYLAPAAIGAWVQGEAEVLRTTRNMVFMQGMIEADDTPIARVSGIFKIGPAAGELNRDFFGIIV